MLGAGDDRRAVAVITGAGTGLGRASAVELANRGFDIVAVGLFLRELLETSAAVEGCGGRARAVEADISRADQLRPVREAAEQLGGAGVLVNNAAIYPSEPWDNITEDDWDRVSAVNLKGAFPCCKALKDQLRNQ